MKIISGLQTGIDELALSTAYVVGLETGGTCPINCIQEGNSPAYSAADLYKVVPITPEQIEEYKQRFPCPWGKYSETQLLYLPRTWMNVKNSDATLYFNFGETDSRGLQATQRLAKAEGKPFWLFEKDFSTVEDLQRKIRQKNITILNIAGNRFSSLKSPEAFKWMYERVLPFLSEALRRLKPITL